MEEVKKEPVIKKVKEVGEPPKGTGHAPVLGKKVVLKNTTGKEVPEEDYFFGGTAPSGFEGTCGLPVEREDLLGVFNKVFSPADNFLFYKQKDKEVYLVIVPIKYSTTIGDYNNSISGDFQKHAISFINEGSVNLDTLKMKLKRIPPFCKFTDR
jgi:hypothetical protein